MSSKDVAEGYGLSASGLRSTKERYLDELEEGKHYIMKPSQKGTPSTYWTKEGVVMLGFFIKTPTAKEFRRWASNYIVSKQAEEKANNQPKELSRMELALMVIEAEKEKEKLLLENKELVKTKAYISDKKTATAMATASVKAREKAISIPKTYIEALRAHLESVQQLEEANKVITLQAPKVEIYDSLMSTDDLVYLEKAFLYMCI